MPVCNRCYEIVEEPCRNDTETMYCPKLVREPMRPGMTKSEDKTMTNEEKAKALGEAFKTLLKEATDRYVQKASREAADLCEAEPDSAARVYDILKGLGGVK